MKYPLIIMVPILMFLDYCLTISGAYLFKKRMNCNTTDSYELNPAFKKSVEKLHMIDLHHVISAAVITALLIILEEKNLVSLAILQFLVGALSIPLAAAVGRHITNMLIILYARQHTSFPALDTHIPHILTIKISQYNLFFLLIPLLVITYAQPSTFVFGGIFSISLLILWHQFWFKKESSV